MDPKPRVVMLVNNPCVNDSRVIRQAEALSVAGYDAIVLARRARGVPIREIRNGVEYRRLIGLSENWYPETRRRARLAVYLRSYPLGLHWDGAPVLWMSTQWWRWKHRKAQAQTKVLDDKLRRERDVGSPGAPHSGSSGPARPQSEVLDNKSRREHEESTVRSSVEQRFGAVSTLQANIPLPDNRVEIVAATAAKSKYPRILQRALGRFQTILCRIYRTAQAPVRKLESFARKSLSTSKKLAAKCNRAVISVARISKKFVARCARVAVSGARTSMRVMRRIALGIRKKIAWMLGAPVKSIVRRVKPVLAGAFVFEDVDVAMRRELVRLRPQVIHAHDLMTLPTASAVAADIGSSLVYDSHELEMHRNADYAGIVWKRRGILERHHIRGADLTITVSDSIADHLRDAYQIARPIVIMNAPAAVMVHDGGKTVRKTLRLPASVPLAIYVGSVTINRGLEVCVEALNHYPELHFAAVGPRNKAVEAKLLALAGGNGTLDRLHLVNAVAPDAVVDFIHDADVSVLPIQNVCLSYYYCLPNKLFESVLAGLPVAVADLVELRRFVERFRCGVVMDETDPLNVAESIRRIIENRENYVLLPDALAYVRENYSWPAQAAKLLEAYRGLVANSTPSR